MSGTPKSPIAQEKLAQSCGMDRVQWLTAKGQADEAKTRGRRPADQPNPVAKLATWGEVAGQGDLFAVEGER